MSIESDLIALADRVRDFIDQEIPNVVQWNTNPVVLEEALRLLGPAYSTLENRVDDIDEAVHDLEFASFNEWVPETAAFTYLDTSTFRLTGDQTVNYHPGARVRATLTTPTKVIGNVKTVAYNPGLNATDVVLLTAILAPTLSAIERAAVNQSLPMIRTEDVLDQAITTPKLGVAPNGVGTPNLNNQAVTTPKLGLAPNGVGTGQLNDQAVITSKLGLSPNGVNTQQINDRAVTAAKIAETTTLVAQATVAIGFLDISGLVYPELGALMFNLTRYGHVMIFADVPAQIDMLTAASPYQLNFELRQGGSPLATRVWTQRVVPGALSTSNPEPGKLGEISVGMVLHYQSWWGPGSYRISIHGNSSGTRCLVWTGQLTAIQFA